MRQCHPLVMCVLEQYRKYLQSPLSRGTGDFLNSYCLICLSALQKSWDPCAWAVCQHLVRVNLHWAVMLDQSALWLTYSGTHQQYKGDPSAGLLTLGPLSGSSTLFESMLPGAGNSPHPWRTYTNTLSFFIKNCSRLTFKDWCS